MWNSALHLLLWYGELSSCPEHGYFPHGDSGKKQCIKGGTLRAEPQTILTNHRVHAFPNHRRLWQLQFLSPGILHAEAQASPLQEQFLITVPNQIQKHAFTNGSSLFRKMMAGQLLWG